MDRCVNDTTFGIGRVLAYSIKETRQSTRTVKTRFAQPQLYSAIHELNDKYLKTC